VFYGPCCLIQINGWMDGWMATLYKCYSRTHSRIKVAVLCKFTEVITLC